MQESAGGEPKKVLITGASGGIGRIACGVFWRGGWGVSGTTRHEGMMNFLQGRYNGGEFLEFDAGRPIEPDPSFLDVDVLVNNAGINVNAALADVRETIPNEFDVNFWMAVDFTQWVVPHMKKRGGGKIINIASTVGVRGCPYHSIYSASKHALVGFSHSIREELKDDGIDVSVIYPGATQTKMNEGKTGLMDPRQVADAIYFAATRDKGVCCDLYVYPQCEKRKP